MSIGHCPLGQLDEISPLDAAKSDGQVPRFKGPISGEDFLKTDGH